MLAVRISKELEARLSRLAQSADRSKSYYVKKALEKYLEEEEERQIAQKAYEAYVKSGKKTYSFEEVMERNGL
jgi:RHH-type rel operon transcriptional repressor/antitoxin RelB